ncbi:MAG TPA: hypothetical protein VN616_04740 [Puia sp.]|nr:hypothetical protein [Puia sp.]
MGKITISSIVVEKCYSLLGRCCRLAFTLAFPRKLAADKPLAGTDLLLFSGRKGAKMMKAVLLSIYYNWEKIPRLTLVSDGTPKEVLEAALRFWPYPWEIKSWEDCAAWHRAKGRRAIIDFAQVNPYARKLLSVLAEAERRPVFYCDTDVLWFAQPSFPSAAEALAKAVPSAAEALAKAVPSAAEALAKAVPSACVMRISRDNMHCYHPPAIRYLHREDLMDKPAVNCGVVYLSGSVYDNYPEFEGLMEFMRIFNEPFSEQTTFAILADRFGDTWTLDEIILDIKDIHWPLLPRYLFTGTQFARHHVATKHSWFWRDALVIRLRNRKPRRVPTHAIVPQP